MRNAKLYIILLLCLSFDAYLNVLGGDFVYDDYYFIRDNPGVQTLSNFGTFFTDISRTSSQELQFDVYRPLTTISFALTHAAFGLDPFFYHLFNVILHAMNTVLVFYLARRVINPPQPPFAKGGANSYPPLKKGGEGGFDDLKAFFIAAIFAVHPVQTEAVSWISGRGNVQSLFFMLAAFLLFVRWSEGRDRGVILSPPEADEESPRMEILRSPRRYVGASLRMTTPCFYLASLLLYIISMFSKESGIVLPVLIVAWYAFVPCDDRRRTLGRHLLRLTPFFAAAGGFVLLRIHFLGQLGQVPLHGGDYLTQGLVAIQTTAAYLRIALAPVALTVEYTPLPPAVLYGPLSGIVLSAIILAVYFPLRLRKRSFLYPLGMAWFFIALSPTMNIIPIRTFVNERFLYLPIVGFAFILVQGAFDIQESLRTILPFTLSRSKGECGPLSFDKLRTSGRPSNNAAIIFLVVVLCLYSVRTVIRNRDWAGPIPMWSSVLRDNPNSTAAAYILGVEYYDIQEVDKAIGYYLLAMSGYNDSAQFAMINIAQIFRERGETEKAMALNEDTMRLYPDRPAAFINQGWIYMMNIRDYKTAESLLLKALEINPNSYYVHEALGELYGRIDKPELAERHREKAAGLNPYFGLTGAERR